MHTLNDSSPILTPSTEAQQLALNLGDPTSSSGHIQERSSGIQSPRKRVDIVSVQLVKESSIHYAKRVIRSPKDAAQLFRDFLGPLDREYFVVLCLNVKNEPTHLNIAHMGSLNSSIVHPREVFKPAILSNAGSVMVCHNHPSGHATPSPEDLQVTKRLKQVGEYLGIELLDHIILGDTDYVSLREKGQM